MKKIIFTIVVLCCLTSCWLSKQTPCQSKYTFVLPFETSTMEDTIAVGDTIWVSAHFGDVLAEEQSGEEYLFDKNNFYSEFLLYKIDTVSVPQAEGFTYDVEIGDRQIIPLQGGIYTNLIIYDYQNNEYRFKMALVPSQKGVYFLTFLCVMSETVEWKWACGNAPVDFEFSMNGYADNHYYLAQHSPDTTFTKVSLEYFNTYGGYCFVVE